MDDLLDDYIAVNFFGMVCQSSLNLIFADLVINISQYLRAYYIRLYIAIAVEPDML